MDQLFELDNPNKLTVAGKKLFMKAMEKASAVFEANEQFLNAWQESQSSGMRSRQIATLVITVMKSAEKEEQDELEDLFS